jgi:hypothetical protein
MGRWVGFEFARNGWAYHPLHIYISHIKNVQNEERGTSPIFFEVYEALRCKKKNYALDSTTRACILDVDSSNLVT